MNYSRVIKYVLENPWAIRPEVLGAIIDVLAYRADGGQFTDAEISERVSDVQAAEAARSRETRMTGSIAVIPLLGSIFPRANIFTQMSGGTSLQMFAAALAAADRDDQVSAIVLDVASPGGMVDLVPETAEMVRNASKPTTAVAAAEAASAAYWIAAQADELVVSPSGMVGSIGVWMAHEDWSKHDANLGVDTTLISAGKKKVDGNPFEPLSDRARADMQDIVDTYYDMFVDAVAKGRNTSTAAVREGFGEGGMVTAEKAVTEGMADRVASLDQVIVELVQGSRPQARRLAADGQWQSGGPVHPGVTFEITDLTTTSQPEESAASQEETGDEESDFYEALLENL